MHTKFSFTGFFALILCAALWGIAFIPQKIGGENIPTTVFVGLRFSLAALLFSIPVLLYWAKQKIHIHPKQFGTIVILGLLLFLGQIAQQYGVLHTSAGKAGFLTSLYLLMIPIILFLFGKKISGQSLILIFVALVGTYFLSIKKDLSFDVGDVWIIVSCVFWALHIILTSSLAANIQVYILTWGQVLVCGIFSLSFGLFVEYDTFSVSNSLFAWKELLFLAIFPTGIGIFLQMYGQKHTSPISAGILLSSEGLFALIASYIFLEEVFTNRMYLGAALLLFATICIQYTQHTAQKNSTSP